MRGGSKLKIGRVNRELASKTYALAALLTATLVVTLSVHGASCDHHDEWRNLADFSQISVTAPVTVVLHQSDSQAQEGYCLEGDGAESINVSLQVSDGVMYIDGVSTSQANDVVVHLASRTISDIYVNAAARVVGHAIEVSRLVLEGHGASEIDIQNVTVGDLVVAGFGGAQITTSGTATHQSVDIDGIGTYLAPGLATETSQVSVRGAGRVELWVEELLDVDILGAASVIYTGSPWVTQQITGHGALHKL
ncbi:MAG: DUF2807 domain-containing protein [Pseudomonadota bacterium]